MLPKSHAVRSEDSLYHQTAYFTERSPPDGKRSLVDRYILRWRALAEMSFERRANAFIDQLSQPRIALQIDCANSQRCTFPFDFGNGNERFSGFWAVIDEESHVVLVCLHRLG